MSLLLEIRDSINDYINMMVTVLDMTVDVVDEDLIRVASMGRFNSSVGERVKHGSIFSSVMREHKDVIIGEPQTSEHCRNCDSLDFCGKFARIYTPIDIDGTVIGAICMHSNSAAQNETVLTNISQYMNFLHSLADLISLKSMEHSAEKVQKYNLNLQKQLMNIIEEGVMLLDNNMHPLYMNEKSEYTIGCTIEQINYLSKHNMFSIRLREQKVGNKVKYAVKVREQTIIIEGRSYLVNNESDTGFNVVLIFEGLKNDDSPSEKKVHRETKLSDFPGQSHAFVGMIDQCKRAAYRGSPVLLEGESGTGKHRLAAAIHNEGPHRNGVFIVAGKDEPLKNIQARINQSESQPQDFDRPFFTVYVDEIVKLGWEDQRILLELVLTNNPVNFKVICSTMHNFKSQMQEGNILPDLYYALECYRIEVPSLMERNDDIILLSDELLENSNRKNGRNISFSKGLKDLILKYSWPGNITELSNFITFIVEQSNPEDGRISENEIPSFLRQKLEMTNTVSYNIADAERNLIRRALNELEPHGFSKREVARKLGISPATLYRKMEEYKIVKRNHYEY